MKIFLISAAAMLLIIVSANTASASVYASSIVDGTTLHNWNGGCHGDLDASVILGAPDNELTGWGGGESGYVTLGFDYSFADEQGDDLIVYGFGPGNAELFVSTDNAVWTSLGALGKSSPGATTAWGYDFADFGVAEASYVKIVSGMAKFIDAVEGVHGSAAPVPVPAAIWLMASGIAGVFGFRRAASS